jgi:hypothetical protein
MGHLSPEPVPDVVNPFYRTAKAIGFKWNLVLYAIGIPLISMLKGTI